MKLLLKPQKLLLKKRGCAWYRLHEYPLSSSFFLESGNAILNQYFFIRYAHFTWHSNTPLLTSSKLDLETACYCWVRTFSTTILRFTGYGYFQFVHINFVMNKETINQLGKAKPKSAANKMLNYNTSNIEYSYEVVYWFLLAWHRFFKTNFSDLSLSKLIRQLSYRVFIDRKQ